MVTAETAVVLPVLLLVLAGAVAAMIVVGAQLRCVDAAREGARAAARGDPIGAVEAVVGTGGSGRGHGRRPRRWGRGAGDRLGRGRAAGSVAGLRCGSSASAAARREPDGSDPPGGAPAGPEAGR